MTEAAQQFITPLSVGALAGEAPFVDLFDAKSEFDVGHIRLAREADLIVVAPATADLMAKLAGGLASDLASAVLLATDKKILLAPAMNPMMWANKATRRNLAQLKADGAALVGPNVGEMAESGETGVGRMAEPLEIVAAAQALLAGHPGLLAGKHVLVTSGPTHEPIDPVRYIANRSSGKQGHAIAEAAAAAGAKIVAIADTHVHADYLSGGPGLAQHLAVPYHLHPADAVFPYDGTPGRIAFSALADGQVLAGNVPMGVTLAPAVTMTFDALGRTDLGSDQSISVGPFALMVSADSGFVQAP